LALIHNRHQSNFRQIRPRVSVVAHRRQRRRAAGEPGKRSSSRQLTAPDRTGHRAIKAIADAGQSAISGALLPVMVRGAALCTDDHATFERMAKDERIPHFALNSGRRSKRTPRSHHINTVNDLISRFRSLDAAVLRSSLQEPRSRRSMVCRTRQCRSQP